MSDEITYKAAYAEYLVTYAIASAKGISIKNAYPSTAQKLAYKDASLRQKRSFEDFKTKIMREAS